MSSRRRFRVGSVPVFLIIGLGVIGGGGCDGTPANSPEIFDRGALDEVADLYRATSNQRKRPPASLKDFGSQREALSVGYNAVRTGKVVVYWGVEMLPAEPAGTTQEVLGYGADVPTKGGAVLLRDGSVVNLSASAFAAAPKPAGPTSAPAGGEPARKAG